MEEPFYVLWDGFMGEYVVNDVTTIIDSTMILVSSLLIFSLLFFAYKKIKGSLK